MEPAESARFRGRDDYCRTVKNRVGRALNVPGTGGFKTRHSLAIDVRMRMRGQVAPDGDRAEVARFGGDAEEWVPECGNV